MVKPEKELTVSEPFQIYLNQLIDKRFADYGLLPKCKKCLNVQNGCRGQYNAPGLDRASFFCGDYEGRRG